VFDSFEDDSDAEGGPGFSVFWRGGDADYVSWRFDTERPWALHETPVSGDRDGYITPNPPPEEVAVARERVATILEALTEKQKFVLQLRWGVGERAHRPYTCEEIGALVGGISKQAVSRIEKRALDTLNRKYA
jgi:DNA-directed RNA polymerase specialized sigma subunit